LRQRFESDEVIAELGGSSFMTKRGLVVEGNYQVGDHVLLVFDRVAKRYLPVFKRKTTNIRALLVERGETGAGVKKTLWCEVELLDVPVTVPPMKWYSQGIGPGELEDIDYFKTYYRVVNQGNCQECTEDFSICTKEELSGPQAGTLCTPFKFGGISLPHKVSDPPQPDDEYNHCVESTSMCQAEIIGTGEDIDGKYILWKAYTEWSLAGPEGVVFSRTGHGWMKFSFMLKSSDGGIVCIVDEYVEVECCLKNAGERVVELWDQSLYFGPGRPFMWVGGEQFYKTPAGPINLYDLYYYALFGGGMFWIFPDIQGACMPYEWELQGPGQLIPAEHGQYAQYVQPSDWNTNYQCQGVYITVNDRCGLEDMFRADCCAAADEVSIGYTTLTMGCGMQQQLTAMGGCPPYSWALTGGGGTLVPSSNPAHDYATYTAPNDNPNCVSNPTIEVTDCCGISAELKLAVNCAENGAHAFMHFHRTGPSSVYCGYYYEGVCAQVCFTDVQTFRDDYRCDGSLLESHPGSFGNGCTSEQTELCDPAAIKWDGCCQVFVNCGDYTGCYQACGYFDVRVPAQKEAGCCPINPGTGLPF
jgi:hypothetical protein